MDSLDLDPNTQGWTYTATRRSVDFYCNMKVVDLESNMVAMVLGSNMEDSGL